METDVTILKVQVGTMVRGLWALGGAGLIVLTAILVKLMAG